MSAGVRTGLVAVLSGALTSAMLVIPASPAGATGSAVTVTPSSSTVAPGSTVDLTAGMPVRDDTGSVTQEIVQTIDPTKVKLTAASDITYPSGWTLSYCSGAATDCTNAANFSATTPASAAAWAAVKAVKATGTLVSSGSDSGRQVAQSTASGTGASTAPATLAVSAGVDGFQVFFDANRTRAFNIYHHQTGSLDCWVVRTGARCPGFPYAYGGYAAEQSIGRVVGSRIWIPGSNGLYCVDISAVLSSGGAPTACTGGQIVAGLLPLGSSTRFTNFAGATALGSEAETKLYAVDSSKNPATAYCADTATQTACTPITTSIPGAAFANDFGNSVLWDGRLYILTDSKKVTCVNVDGTGLCPGWSTLTSSTGVLQRPSAASPQWGKLFELPDSSGGTRAVCMAYQLYSAGTYPCWNASGVESPASTFNFPQFTLGTRVGFYGVPVKRGSKLYFGNGMTTALDGEVLCYDASANSGAGGRCNGAATNLLGSSYPNYTVTPDPIIDNCLWITGHDAPVIQTRNLLTGASGCSALATTQATFSGATTVPRMGCSATGAIASWRSFRLNSVTGTYTTATLTVKNSSGNAIPGWIGRSISVGAGGEVDLSALSVATSGQSPTFIVDFSGASGSLSASASLSAVGDAPQLCTKVTALAICPVTLGPVKPAALLPGSFAVTGSGSSTVSGVTTAFTPDTESVAVSAPTSAQCGSTLTGRASMGAAGAGTGVGGIAVSLVDDTGNALLDDSGIAITTTTDDSGNYYFGFLTPGKYKVRFPSTSTWLSLNAQTASGGAGSVLTAQNAVSGTSTSGTDVLLVGTNGVVNGQYAAQPIARPNTSTGAQGALQTIAVLADDSASTGASYTGGLTALKLCTSGQVYPSCTGTSLSVTGQGTYAVSGSNITFTPCSASNVPAGIGCTGPFSGPATAATYQSTDSLGRTGSSTVSPTVIAAPTLTDDTSTGLVNTVQTISPLANDAAGAGVTLNAASVKLCTSGTANSSCTGTSLTVGGQGVYSVNGAGVVTFTPCQATGTSGASCTGPFVGAATPIKYVVSDSLTPVAQQANSTIAVTVTAPANVAVDDTSVGGTGLTQSVNPLTNDTAPAGVTLKPTTVKLCTSGQSPPSCTGSSLIVTGVGVYTVNATTGVISFTPCNTTAGTLVTPDGYGYAVACTGSPFTGTPTGARYQVTDNVVATARTVSGVYTPTVAPPPAASPNAGTGAWDQVQSFLPFADDTPVTVSGITYPFSAASVKICLTSTADASCTATTSLTVANQGTWSMNPATGVVSFDPLPAFVGAASPVKYCVSDVLNQRACSTITPTVTPPPSPTAASETKSVQPGASVNFTTVTGAGGLGTSGGPALVTSNSTLGTGLCPVGTVLPGQVANCTQTAVTITGEGTYTLNTTTGVVTYTTYSYATTGPKTPITYVIRDAVTSGGRTNWASATLTPFIPGPPVARDDTASLAWDVTQSVNVLGNDSVDVGQSLVASSVRLCGAGDVSPACDDTQVTTAQGTYTVNLATGAVSFDPLPTFWGTATPITYTVTDSQGLKDPATLTVTVAAPGLPVAGDDTVLVAPGGSGAFDALIGAGGLSTSGGPALVSACLWVSGACDLDGVVTVNSGGGVYVLDDTTKVVTFHACTAAGVPHASCTQALSGQPTPVTYRVTDAVNRSDTGVLTARVPVAPVSRDDSSMAEAGATQVLTPLGNDQGGDAALNVASLRLCGLAPSPQTPPNCTQTSITTAAGTYTVSGGAVTFVPADDAPGTDVDVRYQVADVFGQTSSAVIRVTELPKPAPRAAPNAASGPYGQSLTFSPLADDTYGTVPADDSTNNVLTQVLNAGWLAGSLKLCGTGQAPPGCDKTSVTTADGTYAIAGTDVVFTGNASFTGTVTQPVMYQVANTYTVQITDYNGSGTPVSRDDSKVGSSTITPTITVAPVAAVPDTASTPWNTPVTDNVLADDTSGAAINAGALKLCGPNDAGVCAQTSVTVAGQGTFDLVGNQVRFTPLPGFSGAVDPVTYRTTDALGRPISSTFTPTVAAPNGPTASPEVRAVLAGGSVAFTTLAESGPLVAAGVNSAGANPIQDGATCLLTPGTSACDADGVVTTADGTYVLNPLTGVVSYTADPDAPSGAQIPVSYRVVDSIGLTATSTLTPTVYARPVVQAKAHTDVMNLDQVFTVLADDTHDPATTITGSSVRLCGADDTVPDCTQLTRALTGVGVFSVDLGTGAITFNPDDTYVGAVPAVTYSADDTLGQRTSATLTPTVVALPKPAAVNDTGSANSGSPIVFRPWTNDDTIDGPRGASVTTATLVPTSIQLCGPGDVPLPAGAGCDDTTVTTADGTYVLDPATGEVTFTGASGFTGVATTPVNYQIATDYTLNAGSTQTGYATAQLIPTINAPAPGGGGGGGTPPGGGGGGGTPPGGGGAPSPSPSPTPGPDPVPVPDGGVGRPGEPVRVDPIGNDSPGQGQVFDEGSLRLCPEGSTPPGCSGLVVETDQGAWVVDPFTGAVVFTPAPGFEGLAEVPYQLQTQGGEVVDSVISIWITDPPAAEDDASSGQVDRPQTLDPWTNDAHDAAPWDRGSLALCGSGQSPPGCDQSRVETPDGVYEIDLATGRVVFTPAPGFTGQATPLQYQVADVAGQVASAWLRPTVRSGGGGESSGWLRVRKVVTGNELRTGTVKILTVCTDGDESMRKVHRLPVARERGDWRVPVPAGMRCRVAETAHGAPKAQGVAPMWQDRRWAVDHAPTIEVGARVKVGTAVPIDRLILKAQGGCEIRAGVLQAVAAGTCTITWRAPDGQVTTSTRWTHVGPRGTRVEAGTLTRAFVVRDGAETKVTFHNRYRTQDQVVTRTVYITPECPTTAPKQATWTAPWASPQAMAAYAPRGGPTNPGTCPPRS